MLMSESLSQVFTKETLVKGQPAKIDCIEIAGQVFSLSGGYVKVLRLEDEWFQEVNDPDAVLKALKDNTAVGADIFTFCQRLPNIEPRFGPPQAWESIAAVQVDTYDRWLSKQIEPSTRNKVRKSQKMGVEVRECSYDDEFVRGMTSIFNETPVRQGRRFWHYGKDFDTVKRQFSRYLFREELIGAYYRNELIGFAMLGKSASYADLGQIISKVAHREKASTNALIAKAVEICCARGIPNLVYAFWTSDDGLGEFKRQSGFREVKLPRYFVPLTVKGRLAMSARVHHGFKSLLPVQVTDRLKHARKAWYSWQERRRTTASH
jgi:hypothetical protein